VNSHSLLFFFIFGCVIVTALAVGIIYYVVIQKQRQIKEHLERQKLAFDYQDALLRSRLEAQETTLSAVSLELHDSVNQMLTVGVSQFRLAELHMQDADGLKALEEGRETVRRAIAAIRSLSHSLHTGLIADMSLEEALTQEIGRVAISKALEASLEVVKSA
jgi:two-component system, NarL family, sensor kinase